MQPFVDLLETLMPEGDSVVAEIEPAAKRVVIDGQVLYIDPLDAEYLGL